MLEGSAAPVFRSNRGQTELLLAQVEPAAGPFQSRAAGEGREAARPRRQAPPTIDINTPVTRQRIMNRIDFILPTF